MKELLINKNDAGKRLDKFLICTLSTVPKSLICKLIRKKRIKVNGSRVSPDYRLQKFDVISLHLRDDLVESKTKNTDFLSSSSDLDIIYEDKNLMIINKPRGLLCHPDKNTKINCLINRIKKYLYEKKEYNFKLENSFSPSLINRIDRNTNGLVISCKNAYTLNFLNQKMKKREIKKFYVCAVHGIMEKKNDTLISYLFKDSYNNTVKISKKKIDGYKIIKTKYRVIEEYKNISILEVELLTGRTHQIRAHLASINHPIIGDNKYATHLTLPFGFRAKHQLLTSHKIEFEFSDYDEKLNYLNRKEFKIGKFKHFSDNLKTLYQTFQD